MTKKMSFFSINLLLLLCLIKLSINDTCQYKQDGTGLLNSYHQLYLNGYCYPCRIQCKTCNNIHDITCSSGNCQNHFYFDQSLNQCVKCASLCRSCNGPLESNCQFCLDGLYFNSVTKSCQNCPFGARTCNGMKAFSCQDRYFLDSQSFLCRKCPINCFSCTSQSSCQKCEKGHYFVSTNICKKCEVSHCNKCFNQSTCYECSNGYDLISLQCVRSNCTQSLCTKCPGNKDNCTMCAQGYYLLESKCYFGSSLLCLSGEHGSSYGKCASCRQGISYTNEDNPSYCLVSQSQQRSVEYEFKSFSQFVGCNSPYFLSREGLKIINLEMVVEPIFQVDVEVRLISKLSQQNIKMAFQDANGSQNFQNTNNSKRNSSAFFCNQKSLLLDTDKFKIHRIYQSFYVNSLNSNISLIIQDLTNTSEIYLSEVYIKKMLCLVQNCQACFTTGFCSSCKNGYLLEQYQCKESCSEGYFTDSYHQECVQECRVGYFLVPEEFKCEICQAECSSCTGINLCSKCSSGYFLQNNLCLQNCTQNTTYPDTTNNQCKRCKNPCKTCSIIGSNCTSCLQGNLLSGKCIAECPFSHYSSFQSSVTTCSLCSSSCKSCSIDADYCTACNQNLTLYDGKCLSTCPPGYFQSQNFNNSLNSILKNCDKCLSICSQCQITANNCTSCNVGFLLLTTFQALASINQSVFNQQISTIFDILELNPATKAGTCLTKCPTLYFFEDQANKACIRCPISCLKCQNLNKCSKCVNQYFLDEGACLSKCTSLNFYMNNRTNKCERCKIPCETCQTDFSGNNCITCVNGYYQFIEKNENFSATQVICMIRCPIGFYKNNSQTRTCQPCHQNCSECLTLLNCTKCKSGYFLSDKNVCASTITCSDGFFFDNSTNSCQRCHESCKKCENYSYFCIECSTTNLLIVRDQGVCLNQCPQGYFQKTVYIIAQDSSKVEDKAEVQNQIHIVFSSCENCPKQCFECFSQSQCTKCIDDYAFLSGKCITTCPLSYYEQNYPEDGNVCISCRPNCKRCFSASYCLECEFPSIFIDNQCLNSCLDGYYLNETVILPNITNYQCVPCPIQCQTCKNPTICTSCSFGYFLEFNQTLNTSLCKTSCPSGFFKNRISRTCDPCKFPCKTCTNGLVCLSCLDNLTLLNQNCHQNCPDTFYFTEGSQTNPPTCKLCVSPCKKCRSIQQCTECLQGFFLNEAQFTCEKNCQQGFYPNSLTKICQKCEKPCKTCSSNARDCISCIDGFYLRNNLCLSVCPSGTFLDNNGTTYLCKSCPQSCLTCQSTNLCTKCKLDHYLYVQNQNNTEQSCVRRCPEGHYASKTNRKCNKCQQNCQTCIRDKFTCTSCKSSEVLLRNKCVQKCPTSYYLPPYTSVCEQCGKWCQKCNSKNQCTQCISGYLFGGQCLSSCPSGYYQNKENLVCSKCMIGCEICKNQFTCEKCSKNESFVLFSSHCIQSECPQGLYLFVQENECIQNCQYLVNKAEQKCHEQKCPPYLIKSQDGKQCIEKCQQDEFIRYLQSQGAVKCEDLSYFDSQNMNYDELPQFKLEVVPQKNEIIAILRFSFDGIKTKSVEEVLEDISFALKPSSQNYFGAQEQQQQNKQIKIEIGNFEKRLNTLLVHLKITNQHVEFEEKFGQQLTLEAQMKKHYLSYFKTINGQNIPIQNYKYAVEFQLLNYSQQAESYLGLNVIVWILMVFAIIIMVTAFLIDKKRPKIYIFASLVEFFQIIYFLAFVSVNLPSLIESLFYSFRFSTGNFVISTLLTDYLPWRESTQIMVSPWQFYKYSGDIHLFRNLSDIFIMFGLIIITLIISKIMNSFTKIGSGYTAKILSHKAKIIEVFLWLFLPLTGLYSMINIRLYIVDQKYQSQLQKSIGYKILSYLMVIGLLLSCVYFLYYQFMDKTMFDMGINQQKKKLGVSIGLYRYVRKVMFVFFMAFYYENSIYCTCIFLLSTSIIFIMVFWFQPYKNPFRQLLSTIEESSLIILFSEILIFILNPDYYTWISFIIVIHTILHVLLLLVYPTYWLTKFIIHTEDTQIIDKNPNSEQIDSAILNNNQKDQLKQDSVNKQTQENFSATKINFAAIIKKKNEQNLNDQLLSANQADESDQGEVIKKKIVDNVIRLAKKQTKKAKMFKNYDFSSEDEQNEEMDIRKEMKKKISQIKSKKHQK